MKKFLSRTFFFRSLLSLALISLIFIACYKAPVTGRNQLILLSHSQETQMGVLAFQQVVKEEKVSKNPVYNTAVKRVSSRIVRVSHSPNLNWEYKVFDDNETINAFALPGGKIGVYTGILKIAETDAGLATVIGHEVAHATARHGGERVSAGILAQLGAAGLAAALGDGDTKTTNAVLQAYGLGVTVGGILPFSRTQESEADRIGLIYMAKAGYDPRESIKFWQRMDQASREKTKPPEFLSTHPGHQTRIRNLQKWMPEALAIYNKSPKVQNHRIVASK